MSGSFRRVSAGGIYAMAGAFGGLNVLNEISAGLAQTLLVISLIAAAAQTYFGYRLLRFWISLTGFLIGFALAASVAYPLAGEKMWIPVLAGVVAGALVSFASYKLYLAGVFVYCGLIAAGALSRLSFPEGTAWNAAKIVVCVAAFIVVGLLAVRFSRPVIIILTVFGGAANATRALGSLWLSGEAHAVERGGIFLFLVVSGLAVQFLMTRGKGHAGR